ncbi:MAG: 1-deoxy-D-xylulose-5-phosphate reductoisomerase [Clostridia bacterium]|jgi:1-deoxy-D-xylulose-5-phosphate reductoisomerase|nr:1-deoxy-D-xylulose-5-phosphate reductoisomerase [Clostridia bacterium]
MKKLRVGILGSTGSIGTQTLQVIAKHPDSFEVALLSCKRNIKLLSNQISQFNPSQVIHGDTTALNYPETYKDCDIVINGISGFAGLTPTIAVLQSDSRLATANKESLVCFGTQLRKIANESGKTIFPVDSEHSAILQCLEESNELNRLILTASGGPFKGFNREQLSKVTSEDAIKHPTWKMGLKVTVDSSTLMNKGMELIEAKHLFSTQKIDVLIHRESIVHSLVEFKDRSIKALLSNPDMTIPIQYALSYPVRLESDTKYLDLSEIGILTFGKPDYERFPCLNIAKNILSKGDYEGTVMCVADEVAVEHFLNNKIGFYDISDIIYKSLERFKDGYLSDVTDVLLLATEVRHFIEDRNH